MKIYLAGAITGAPERILRQHEMVAEALEVLGHEVFLPHRDETSEEGLYSRDMREIASSDAIVANVGWPSTGTGIEISSGGKPVVAFAWPEEEISCFVLQYLQKSCAPLIRTDKPAEIASSAAWLMQS